MQAVERRHHCRRSAKLRIIPYPQEFLWVGRPISYVTTPDNDGRAVHGCYAPIALYTKMDDQCDKLVTVHPV